MTGTESETAAYIIIAAYFLPTAIALLRGHRSKMAIAFVNVALGWTGICYLWALIWSMTGNVKGAA